MRVQHPFRLACRSRCITHERSRVFIFLEGLKQQFISCVEKLFVVQISWRYVTASFRDDDDVRNFYGRSEFLKQRQECLVHNDDLVFGVSNNITKVFRAQPYVEGMNNSADGRNSKIRFEMLIVIPTQRRYAVATPDSQMSKGNRQLFGADGKLAVCITVNGLIGKSTDDLLSCEQTFSPTENRRQRKLIIHHQ